MRAWWVFLKERFEPFSHALLLAAFVFAYGSLSLSLSPASPSWLTWLIVYIACLFFFFHLRLFDELKDYSYDLKHNPDRPLPRGLISLLRFKSVCVFVICSEILLGGLLGLAALLSICLAIVYSLFMFKEFFLGSWIRPKLELYAISHTFVAALFVVFIYFALTPAQGIQNLAIVMMMLMVWTIFNIFEFARKTFAATEEREGVDTYSSRWGAKGACIILWVFHGILGISLVSLARLIKADQVGLNLSLGLIFVTAFSALPYSFTPKQSHAKLMRLSHSLFLLLFHLAIGLTFFQKKYMLLP